MKDYTVKFDGTSYPLDYTLDDREAVEALFPRQDGTPGGFVPLVIGHLNQSGSIKVQIALLWGGMRHLGPKWTSEAVAAAVKKFVADGGDLRDIVTAVQSTILTRGVMSKAMSIEDLEGKVQSQEAPPTSESITTS